MSITPEPPVTAAGVQAYLENTASASHTVDLLSGGFTNFTYRIHLHTPIDGGSVFVPEYAPPYVASSIPGGPTREAALFRASGKKGEQKFEEEAFRLSHRFSIQSDQLKEVLINESNSFARGGIALGPFLGDLHGSHERRNVVLSLFAKNEVWKDISARMTYSRIVSTLTSKHEYPVLSNPLLDIPGERLATFSKLEETGSRRSSLRPLRTP
ncbi:hypothetical protein EDD15DRAFT_2203011 [Pisolithus albus]|nr:hypothetical protein EDD15DRAFT_2203011 [Pisolithus albus]